MSEKRKALGQRRSLAAFRKKIIAMAAEWGDSDNAAMAELEAVCVALDSADAMLKYIQFEKGRESV